MFVKISKLNSRPVVALKKSTYTWISTYESLRWHNAISFTDILCLTECFKMSNPWNGKCHDPSMYAI